MFSGAYGERLGRSFRLSNPPTLLSQTKQGVRLAVTELCIGKAGCGMTAPLGKDDAYLLCLSLATHSPLELWYEGQPATAYSCEAGSLYALDIRRDPIAYISGPLHALYFYIPRQAINEMCKEAGNSSLSDLTVKSGELVCDPVVNSIGQALLPLFQGDVETHQPLVDHLLQGLCTYVAWRYSGQSSHHCAVRGTLTPWQQRLAKQMMDERISDGVSIHELAQACSLSTGAFVRGFKKSTGVSPHQWLLFKRVDLAIHLMDDPDISLAKIAFNAGFSDQSHFTRIFAQRMGVSPGAWRKSLGVSRKEEMA